MSKSRATGIDALRCTRDTSLQPRTRVGAAGQVEHSYSALISVAPSSLPEIDAVEVVSLRGLNPNRVDDDMLAAQNARHVRLTGADAARVAGMWRALPGGQQMRCHVPPFGLRFFRGAKTRSARLPSVGGATTSLGDAARSGRSSSSTGR